MSLHACDRQPFGHVRYSLTALWRQTVDRAIGDPDRASFLRRAKLIGLDRRFLASDSHVMGDAEEDC